MIVFVFLFATVWANSLIGTNDIANWLIENTSTFISLLFLLLTYKRYHFSDFSYFLICMFLCLHVYGSKYTYADNSFGFWLHEVLNSPRNEYERIVHFSFGFLLYYPMQECFSKWMGYSKPLANILPITTTLAVGAVYEVIECIVADKFFVNQGIAYLGTQGDTWDSQKDMAIAFLGVILATIFYYVYALFMNPRK
ncbi:DUF2238 domain-containing protein [Maribacter sp. ACAM166]|uniref:DUF2238 domain-containing protein n=1 Tax=Maribacter sp. ACAM166 TaxID=2508996 RepID=UPI0020170A8C|nr:DUF2238 domain-containing protein [Maribacter sp. ACAM166]